jgi:hypothetical protein
MPDILTYDKDGKKIPTREFLSMIIILLKKAEHETGGESLVGWLESLEELDDNLETDAYDDVSLRKAVYKILKENYLDKDETRNA